MGGYYGGRGAAREPRFAEAVAGSGKIDPDYPPNMASEDFPSCCRRNLGLTFLLATVQRTEDEFCTIRSMTLTTTSCRSAHPIGRG